jgi:L-2-hydroxyglutarate oxidase LhgO
MTTHEDAAEVAVIGGGVVGCAVAATLAARGRSVLVLEAAAGLGTGVTSRNSGVIHSGLYYPPGSLKAEACVRGNALLYQWAAAHDVWHRKTGKLVIARTPGEVEALAQLHDNARAAGAPGLSWLSGAELATHLGPLAPCAAALFCAETGIIDVHELVLSLRAAAEAHGATFVLGAAVTGVEASSAGTRLATSRGELRAERVINAAGLAADTIARRFGVTGFAIHPCRGDYFRLRPRRAFRHLIYPVKDPRAPGLGVHLTLERGGGVRLGPDTEWVDARDDFRPAPHKHAIFHAAAERLLGPLDPADLTYDGCGIRPKLRAPDEPDEKDFVLLEQPAGVVHLIGIESPGLTAALDLASRVAARVA